MTQRSRFATTLGFATQPPWGRPQRIFLVGFKPGRAFEFPEFPDEGPKLASILDPDMPEKYTLTDHLWN